MLKLSFAVAALSLSAALSVSAKDYTIHTFKKIQLTDKFWCEGANFGDFNHDGIKDIVSGPYWYEGPDFQKRHEYYPANTTFNLKKPDGTQEKVEGFEGALGVNNTYSDNFFAFTYDFNGDGWDDILIYGFPGKEATWYENPKGREGHWQRHQVFDVVDNESPTFQDINGDGKPDIVCNSGGYFGYATADWQHPEKPWTFHPISQKGHWQRFTHGLGVGDVNGDGRQDLLEAEGWWEQPASLENDPVWKFHKFAFAPGHGSSQMYAYDVNGDGKNDVITALAAHGYGLAWYEQVNENSEITFKKHIIMADKKEPNEYGVTFSQLHSVDLIDMDGDGLKDIVTGKRFWAHGNHGDADPNDPAVVYWFKLVRKGKDQVDFVPFQIDDNSGVGTQVVAGNINKDKLPDIVVGNKKGTFVLLHESKKVKKSEWEKAQPKPVAKSPQEKQAAAK
jgi:FG-GAP-like repeat